MLGYSYMVGSLRSGWESSDLWVVCGKLKRRTKKQVLRDKLGRLELSDIHRVATLGVGGFGR